MRPPGCVLLALALCAPASGQDERVFFAELSVVGPARAVVIEVEGEGVTRIEGELRAGERRTLVVPLPLRAPLWRETLPALTLPAPRVQGGDEGSSAGFGGLVVPQPLAGLEALPPGLRARAFPPEPGAARVRPWGALLALVTGLALSLALRRRLLPLALVSIGCACLVFGLLTGAESGPRARTVLEGELEGDLEAGHWIERRVARDSLALGFDALAVRPDGRPLELTLDFDGRGRVRCPGTVLVARRRVAGPGRLAPGSNEALDLEAVWTRSREGAWRFHGPWARGSALGAARAGAGVPGWLASGLAPGAEVLVARAAGQELWIRASGFATP